MDEEPSGAGDERPTEPAGGQVAQDAGDVVGVPWDDEMPIALGDDAEEAPDAGDDIIGMPWEDDVAPEAEATTASAAAGGPEAADDLDHDEDDGADMGELPEGDYFGGRRNSLPRRVESWRSRTATGAIASAIAMGLQQVFEPERRRPAAVAEAPSDPYADDDPITVDYVPDDAEATTVHVKPWLLQKGEPG